MVLEENGGLYLLVQIKGFKKQLMLPSQQADL